MELSSLLEHAERTSLPDSDGKSGALLERAVLPDGQRVVVKRYSPRNDIFMRVLGDVVGRELVLHRAGVLDRLPDGVGHCVLGGWVDGADTVLVMRDLGPGILGWERRLTAEDCRRFVTAVAELHAAFRDRPPDGLAPPAPLIATFDPERLSAAADAGNPLTELAVRGWGAFAGIVDPLLAGPVLELVHDPGPLVAALARHPPTMCHADLAPVNMAWEGDRLTLIDWGQAAALPGEVDIARFLAGSSQVLDVSREQLLAEYRRAAGPSYDEGAMRLALLAGLVWLGWNKALDVTEHPSPAKRDRERQDLAWWLDRAREALDAGL